MYLYQQLSAVSLKDPRSLEAKVLFKCIYITQIKYNINL